ncbi:MAG: hypothetical protein AAF743_15530, partial [Planctomycetota bacterium]
PRVDEGDALYDLTNLERRLAEVERRMRAYEGPPPQAALEAANRKVVELTDQAAAEKAKLDEVEIDARAAIAEVRSTQDAVDVAERRLASKLIRHPEMIAATEALDEAHDAVEARVKTFFEETTDAELGRLTRELLEARREELRNGGPSARADALNAEQAYKKRRADLLAADAEHTALLEQLAAAQATRDERRAALTAVLTAKLELTDLRERLADAKSASVATADTVKAQRAVLDAVVAQRQQSVRHVADLEARIRAAETELDRLRDDLASIRRSINEARDTLRSALRKLDQID